MVRLLGAVVVSSVLALSLTAHAQDTTSSGSTGSFDYQGQSNLGLAPQTPEASEECLDGQTEATATGTATGSDTSPTTILSPSTDLSETNDDCAALAAVAIGTAGYIETQAAISSGSGIGAAGVLAGAAVLGGTVALLREGGGGGGDPIPFPLPGVGLLSYVVIGASGAVLWLRKRLRNAKDKLRDLTDAKALDDGSQVGQA